LDLGPRVLEERPCRLVPALLEELLLLDDPREDRARLVADTDRLRLGERRRPGPDERHEDGGEHGDRNQLAHEDTSCSRGVHSMTTLMSVICHPLHGFKSCGHAVTATR